MLFNVDDIVILRHNDFELLLFFDPKALNLVDFTELSDCFKKLISSTGLLRFEKGEPKDNSISVLETLDNVRGQVIVNDVLEVN